MSVTTQSKREALVRPGEREAVLPGPWTFELADGTTKELPEVRIRYSAPSKSVVEEAAWRASVESQRAFRKTNPRPLLCAKCGEQEVEEDVPVSPVAFRRELGRTIIRTWNLPYPVGIGWDLLSFDLSDEIEKALGFDIVIAHLEARTNKVRQAAKNSPLVGAEAQPPA